MYIQHIKLYKHKSGYVRVNKYTVLRIVYGRWKSQVCLWKYPEINNKNTNIHPVIVPSIYSIYSQTIFDCVYIYSYTEVIKYYVYIVYMCLYIQCVSRLFRLCTDSHRYAFEYVVLHYTPRTCNNITINWVYVLASICMLFFLDQTYALTSADTAIVCNFERFYMYSGCNDLDKVKKVKIV